MSRSTSKPVEFDQEGSYGSVSVVTVTCTHCRSSDTVSFDFSDGRHFVFHDNEWAAMTKADDLAE
jgi:hypothetical protein